MRRVLTLLVIAAVSVAAFRAAPARSLYEEYTPIEWGLDRIDSLTGGLDHTYEYDFTGAGVRVYIPDSGVDGAQSDFKTLNNAGGTRVEPGTSMYPSTWIGIPGNTDTFAHGTEVASILGGLEYGVAKGVTIVPVRVLDSTGSGSMQGLLNALDWIVADANAQQSARNIINLSIDAAFSFALDAELKALGLANFVVVGAAGNEDSDACMRSPGGSSYVISVGSTAQATNGGDQISSFSNYGPCVSIFAPGSQVPGALANLDENEDIIVSGTSMASPVVAGVAALLWDKYPTWPAQQIRARLLALAALDAIDFSSCDNCSATTVNLLAQVPKSDVVEIDGVDVQFAPAAFSGATNYWPRLAGTANVLAGCSGAMANVAGAVVVLNWASCGSTSSYTRALAAQQAGAVAVLVTANDCFSVLRTSVTLPQGGSPLTIPALCVPPGYVAKGDAVEIGMVRQFLSAGASPWSFTSVSNQAVERFSEWRSDWAATAMGLRPGAACVTFTPRVVSGDAANAKVAVAFSSKPVLGMSATSNPDLSADVYAVRILGSAGSAGWIKVFRNGDNVGSAQSDVVNLDGSTPMYVRAGYAASSVWQVDVGTASDARSLLSVEDSSALMDINYFSLTSSGLATTVVFDNVGPCSDALTAGLTDAVQQHGAGTPQPSAASGAFGTPGTNAPSNTKPAKTSSPAAEATWSAHTCNRIKKKSACSVKSRGACVWVLNKCFYVAE